MIAGRVEPPLPVPEDADIAGCWCNLSGQRTAKDSDRQDDSTDRGGSKGERLHSKESPCWDERANVFYYNRIWTAIVKKVASI